MNSVAFAGQQGFHRGAGTVNDNGIGNNLVSAAENDQISLHDFLLGNSDLLPLPQCMHGWRVQKLQRGYGLLRPVFLKDTDYDVRDDNKQEQHVPVASHQQQTQAQREVQQIEQRKHVGPQNLGNGFFVRNGQAVVKAGSCSLLDFFL